MYEFRYDYIKPQYGEKAKLGFIIHVKTEKIYKDIADDVETRFDIDCYLWEKMKKWLH